MLKILAFAKLNLYLRITGRLPDGYHTLQTVMQNITLSDQLVIQPSHSDAICFSCSDSALEKRSNLVVKACDLFYQTTGLTGGVSVHLQKRIPVAAGLGGGSSDAAAALVALNHLYGAPLGLSQLEALGLRLGADVPFFIRGGCALAEGKGEKLTPLAKTTQYFYVLVKQGSKPSTGEMYAALDGQRSNTALPPVDFGRLPNALAYLNATAENDFLAVSPIGAPVQSDFLAAGADRVLLSGSGPTCFAVFSDHSAAEAVYNQLKQTYTTCFLAADAPAGSLLV